MPSQHPHRDTTPVVQNVRCLANRQNQQKGGPLGNSPLPPAKRPVSVPPGERDSSQGGSSIASTIQSQNITPSSSLNDSRIADITQCMTTSLSATQRRSMNTPTTTMPGSSSHGTPAPGGTSQTDQTRCVVSSPASGIASTPTPLSGLENLPTPIPNPDARTIITNPLRTRATERNQRQRQWQLQPWAVSTPRSVVSGSHSIHRFVSLRHDVSCICNVQTPGALHVEQMAVYECKWLGDGELRNSTRWESISWRPTLADNREVLEHRYAAKQHLVHSIWGTHKGDLESGMLKQWPRLDITCWNRYQVWAQVDKVKSHFIWSARDTIAELYNLHCIQSAAEHLEFIDSLLAENTYHFPVAEIVEGDVCDPNPVRRESTAANKWPASTLHPGRSNPRVHLHQISSSGE